MVYRRRRSRFRREWNLALAFASVALLGLLAYGLVRDDPPDRTSVRPSYQATLFLDGPYASRFAGEMIAAKEGYFDTGVAVQALPDDANFIETVVRENAVGVTTGYKFLLAVWRGAPITAFAASFLDTSVAIFALESSGLHSPADLVGKRVGYREGGEAEAVFDAMTAVLRLPRSQIVKIPNRDDFQMLRAGEVDAIIAPIDQQPSPASADYAPLTIMKPQHYAIHVPGQVYFARSDLVRDQPSTIAHVLHGVVRGWQFAYKDYSRSVPVLVDYNPASMDPERVRFELEQQRSLVLPVGTRIGEYDESRWRMLRDVLAFAGLGKEDAPLFQAVSTQFIRGEYRRSPGKDAAEAFGGPDSAR